jgi:cytochrome c biogenesis protein CcmG, thiol:disulfide interchange protein DsbE
LKKYFSPSNLLTVAVVLFVFWMQFPVIKNNFLNEGTTLSPRSYEDYRSGKMIRFPDDGRSIAIFWASWCGPCKLEMDRLKNSVENGGIPYGKIFAINSFESDLEIRKFINRHNFPFVFINSTELGLNLGIEKTPTTLFIESGKISSMSSGLSFIGIWRAESFL